MSALRIPYWVTMREVDGELLTVSDRRLNRPCLKVSLGEVRPGDAVTSSAPRRPGRGGRYHSPVRSQANCFSRHLMSGDSLRPSDQERLELTLRVERIPGMTVLTASWLST